MLADKKFDSNLLRQTRGPHQWAPCRLVTNYGFFYWSISHTDATFSRFQSCSWRCLAVLHCSRSAGRLDPLLLNPITKCHVVDVLHFILNCEYTSKSMFQLLRCWPRTIEEHDECTQDYCSFLQQPWIPFIYAFTTSMISVTDYLRSWVRLDSLTLRMGPPSI